MWENYDPANPKFWICATTPDAERTTEIEILAGLFRDALFTLDGTSIEEARAIDWVDTLTSPDIYDYGVSEYRFEKSGVLVSADEGANFLDFQGPLAAFEPLVDLIQRSGSSFSWDFNFYRIGSILSERPRKSPQRTVQMVTDFGTPEIASQALEFFCPVLNQFLECYLYWPSQYGQRWFERTNPWEPEVVSLAGVEGSKLVMRFDPVLADVGSWIQVVTPQYSWECKLLDALDPLEPGSSG